MFRVPLGHEVVNGHYCFNTGFVNADRYFMTKTMVDINIQALQVVHAAMIALTVQCRQWQREGRDVFIFFDNDEKGYAAFNAQTLKQLIVET